MEGLGGQALEVWFHSRVPVVPKPTALPLSCCLVVSESVLLLPI